MRYLTVVVLSALLIWFAPHINNSDTAKLHQTSKPHKAAITQTAAKPVQPAEKPVVISASEPKVTETRFASGCETYRSTFALYWSGSNLDTALAICTAESGGNPYALSQTQDRGLMQINSIHADMVNGNLAALYNPATNISVAHKIYGARGWSAWSTYKSGRYLAFL